MTVLLQIRLNLQIQIWVQIYIGTGNYYFLLKIGAKKLFLMFDVLPYINDYNIIIL